MYDFKPSQGMWSALRGEMKSEIDILIDTLDKALTTVEKNAEIGNIKQEHRKINKRNSVKGIW
jgi:hypothetical protein